MAKLNRDILDIASKLIKTDSARFHEFTQLLQSVYAIDSELANKIEMVVGRIESDAVEAGFVAGWQARDDPNKLVFEE